MPDPQSCSPLYGAALNKCSSVLSVDSVASTFLPSPSPDSTRSSSTTRIGTGSVVPSHFFLIIDTPAALSMNSSTNSVFCFILLAVYFNHLSIFLANYFCNFQFFTHLVVWCYIVFEISVAQFPHPRCCSRSAQLAAPSLGAVCDIPPGGCAAGNLPGCRWTLWQLLLQTCNPHVAGSISLCLPHLRPTAGASQGEFKHVI